MAWKYNPFTKRLDYYESGSGGGPFQPLDGDLTAIAALSGTGLLARTGANTWALRDLVDAGSSRVTITNPGGVAGNPTLDVNEAALDLGALGGSLLWSQIDFTGSDLADLATRDHDDLQNVTADQHHGQVHVLATNVALGTDHTVSGATAGHVLRASGATTALFAQLQHADLGGVGVNDHHAQSHVLATNLALGPDHTVSGATAGHVLRASGATTALFSQLQFADLGGTLDHGSLGDLGADDHLQYARLGGRTGGQLLFGSNIGGALENLMLASNTSNDGTVFVGGVGIRVVEVGPINHFDTANYFHSELYGATPAGDTSLTSDHLELWANDNVWTAAMTGRIRVHSQMTWPDGWTLTSGPVPESLMAATATYPFAAGVTALTGFEWRPTITFTTAQVLSRAQAFAAAPIIQPTAAVVDNALQQWWGGLFEPHYLPTAVGCATTTLAGVCSRPMSLPSVATSITDVSAYITWGSDVFINTFNSNVTIGSLIHYRCVIPTIPSPPTVTNHIGVYVPAFNVGTQRMSLFSDSTGNHMRHAGAVRIGDANTAPTDKLEVAAGNATVLDGLVAAARTPDMDVSILTDQYSFVSQEVVLTGSRRVTIAGAGRLVIEGAF